MKRILIITILVLAALALLAGAALKSRSLPLETHVAYYQLNSDISRLGSDFEALVDSLETAWQSSRTPGDAAGALLQRLVAGVDAIRQSIAQISGSAAERQRIDGSFANLQRSMATVENLTTDLLRDQAAYAENLAYLRERGPEVARQLRASGRSRLGADVSQLVTETIEFARPDSDGSPNSIPLLLTTINRDVRIDSSPLPATRALLAAIETLLESRNDTQSRLYQVGVMPLPDNASALGRAVGTAYQNSVANADRARAMLAVYVVVLLLIVGFIGYRLRSSYRALNLANEELAELNESLEHRVEERTHELSDALQELKESQVQLVQAEKMSSLGQLVAGISHEINTPLLYLANNAELVQERIDALRRFVQQSAESLCLDPAEFEDRSSFQSKFIEGLKTLKLLLREEELDAAVEEVVDLNRDSIEGLADLMNMAQSLKDFSRLDRAPIDSFDVNAGLEKTLTIARNTVKHKAEVTKHYTELPPIECSPTQINQVFLNLITNAAQAIDDFGEIVISTAMRGNDQVIVSIRDNGCGIPKENLSKICDPFFTTKEVGSGTGLGLSIVDEIVRSHGGELLVESKTGVGSTFSVVLPIRQTESGPERDAEHHFAEAV
jgi:signal transduction histidine kinase